MTYQPVEKVLRTTDKNGKECLFYRGYTFQCGRIAMRINEEEWLRIIDRSYEDNRKLHAYIKNAALNCSPKTHEKK